MNPVLPTSASIEFRRSRIYAQGWNAANKLTSQERDELDLAQVARLNPYEVEVERSRWTEGFVKALGDESALSRQSP